MGANSESNRAVAARLGWNRVIGVAANALIGVSVHLGSPVVRSATFAHCGMAAMHA